MAINKLRVINLSHKNLFFHPDDTGDTAPKESPPETPPKETPKEEDGPEFIVDGEPFKPTKEQQHKLMALGLETLKERATKKEEPPKKEEPKKEEPVSKDKELEAKIEKLEAKLEKKLDSDEYSAVINTVDLQLEKSGIPESFRDDAKFNILTQYAVIRNKGETVNIGKLSKAVIEKQETKFNALIGKKTDVEKKIEDKKKTELLAGGKQSAGDEPQPPLGKKSFRDGSLNKQVLGLLKGLANKATE